MSWTKKTRITFGDNASISVMRYDNPIKARKLVIAYVRGLSISATDFIHLKGLVETTRDSNDLDANLDRFFRARNYPYPRPRFGGSGPSPSGDEELLGLYSAARKVYEESGNNCCNMQPVYTPMHV